MKKRILSAIVMIALFIPFLIIGGVGFELFMTALAVVGLYELINIREIKNLTKTYGKHRGVSNVTFNVHKGEIFGFLGPNGAGKSTTIRSMLGFIHYQSGVIKIFDKDVSKNIKGILVNNQDIITIKKEEEPIKGRFLRGGAYYE